jgi:hypothetical protein
VSIDYCRGDDCWACAKPVSREQRTYVCDGCMNHVRGRHVAVWADFEHVLCVLCYMAPRGAA